MRAAFLDLNGTLVEPVRVTKLRELTVLPHAIEAVRLLNQAHFLCPVVTVQSRISKAFFSLQDFSAWFTSLRQQFDLIWLAPDCLAHMSVRTSVVMPVCARNHKPSSIFRRRTNMQSICLDQL